MSANTKPYEDKMESTLRHLEKDLAAIRAGRANPAVLDKVTVDYYGTPTPINQVAAVAVAEARVLTITPWDSSLVRAIEKAIRSSDVGINPTNDGRVLRLVFPAPTEERRKQLAKQCAKEAEETKVAIRNARRDGIDKLKKAVKDGLSEDVEKDAEADLQKIHDKKVKRIEEILANKNKEIMTV